MICSAFHAAPKYSSNNPARSRIRVVRQPLDDIYVPVYAGESAGAECAGRDKYVIDGKEYDECAFCRAPCPSRADFKEPDSGLPLKCDMCEGEDEPCVLSGASPMRWSSKNGKRKSKKRSHRRNWRSGWSHWPTNTDCRKSSMPLPGCPRPRKVRKKTSGDGSRLTKRSSMKSRPTVARPSTAAINADCVMRSARGTG
jgi:hypothetical protein